VTTPSQRGAPLSWTDERAKQSGASEEGRTTGPGAPEASRTSRASGTSRLDVAGLEIRAGSAGPDVVRDVSFSVAAGEVFGLVGESGSGKTTVALSLLGHTRRGLTITAGEIRLDGADLLRLSGEELRAVRGAKVSYVPQDPSAALNPALQIGTQLTEALRVHPGVVADPRARIAEVMNEARLDATTEMQHRYPHQLSGGQQQRVALAMAFACRPSLIVLDEPTTGLDVSTQRHILDTVRRLCRSYGVAAVYVSHDLAVISELVSQVAVMYAGRIVELGPSAPLFSEPLHPYTTGLLAAIPTPDRAEVLTGIDGQQPRPGQRGRGCSFEPRCAHALADCKTTVPQPVFIYGRTVRCLRITPAETCGTERPPAAKAVAGVLAPAGAPAALELRSLSARYGAKTALSGIDLEIAPQSCVAIVGESGSGKTTLARCVSGLHQTGTGEMTFQGASLPWGLRQRPKQVLKRIQYIFQNPYTSLNPRKTVGQIVAAPLQQFSKLSREEVSARVAAVLDDVSLDSGVVSRYPDQLSGGERQRVAIARALAVEPDLLICDEVTSALDVSVQAIIVELLRKIQRERQLTMLFITHNLALVRSIAQSAAVLRDGRICEYGPTEQVLSSPSAAYTAELMADVPKLVTH
jgi:peptide/nickel transport system ATP-binding protein